MCLIFEHRKRLGWLEHLIKMSTWWRASGQDSLKSRGGRRYWAIPGECMTRWVMALMMVSVAGRGVWAVALPSEKEHVVSLDGPWRFRLERPAVATSKPAEPNKSVKVDYPAEVGGGDGGMAFYKVEYQE